MAEKLSRIITEKEIARHRRMRQQIGQIKELVFKFMEEETPSCGIQLASPEPIRMNMERRLNLVERQSSGVVKQPANAREKVEDLERFGRLLGTTHVDRKKLWQNVEAALEHKTTATLAEIIGISGLEHGVAEVVGYFGFLREKASRVQSMQEITELIPLDEEKTRFIEVPYLLFSR
jgi:hypothetical protein